MSKGNLFLGQARGSVGDVVFSHYKGKQVARARNRSPRNPQTPIQLLQRVVMATVGKAYSFFAPICDHSFEGQTASQASQIAFVKENTSLLRDKLADVIAYPTDERMVLSEAWNYNYAGDAAATYNRYLISKGSLPSLSLLVDRSTAGGSPDKYASALLLKVSDVPHDLSSITYQWMCDAIGCQPGDQLTVMEAYSSGLNLYPSLDALVFARIIMMPSDGDMTKPFFSSQGVINLPNERNVGSWGEDSLILTSGSGGSAATLSVNLASVSGMTKVAGCAILSRQGQDGTWQRSTQFLLPLASEEGDLQQQYFGEAYVSYKKSSPASNLYLNQAESF